MFFENFLGSHVKVWYLTPSNRDLLEATGKVIGVSPYGFQIDAESGKVKFSSVSIIAIQEIKEVKE